MNCCFRSGCPSVDLPSIPDVWSVTLQYFTDENVDFQDKVMNRSGLDQNQAFSDGMPCCLQQNEIAGKQHHNQDLHLAAVSR